MQPRQGAPACPASRPAMQRECMCGALARFTTRAGCTTGWLKSWNRSGESPSPTTPERGPDARAAVLGQAEAVITSRSTHTAGSVAAVQPSAASGAATPPYVHNSKQRKPYRPQLKP